VLAGQVKMIATDGAGSGAVVYDLLTDVNLAGTTVTDNLTVGGTLGVTGVLTGTSLDISGNVDIDGTTNLDAVDIDGAVQVDATVNVGVDDTGYDVKFFGDTASAYMQWDASADDLILGGAAGLVVPQDKLTIASTAVTSTGAELNQLDAITRGSILYGNASGATARLAKGGANTVLTSDGTDISWAEAGGGGGEQTFTASGSISAGALVGLNTNGTISTMGATAGTPVQFHPNPIDAYRASYKAIVYDTANNKIIQFYRDTANSYYVTCVVGTVSGTSISYGTPVAYSANGTRLRAAYDTNSSRAVCIFRNDSASDDGFAVVVSVSGTTPTFGTAVEFSDANMNAGDCCFDSNSNKVVIAYKSSLPAGDTGKCRVATVSGTSISFGSETTFTTNNPADGLMNCEFDSNLNKVVIAWCDAGNASYGTSIVGTVSGTSISFGSAVVYSSTATYYNQLSFNTNANKFLLTYSIGSELRCKVATVSGTSISFGAETFLALVGGAGWNAVVFDSATNEMIVFFEAATTNYAAALKGPISGTLFFAGAPTVVVPTNVEIAGGAYDEDTDQCILSYQDDSGYNGYHVVFNSANPLWVGAAAESISNGASGKVTVIGGINTNQSSLVAGAVYGLPATATALAAGSSNAIGVALSASNLYINTGKLQ